MPRKPPNFRRSDLQRAIRAAREENLPLDRIEVAKDGGFKLIIDNIEDAAKQRWRREDTEAENWITKHANKR
jgi:hypothetical protein